MNLLSNPAERLATDRSHARGSFLHVCQSYRVRREYADACPWCGLELLEGDRAWEIDGVDCGYCSPHCLTMAQTFGRDPQ